MTTNLGEWSLLDSASQALQDPTIAKAPVDPPVKPPATTQTPQESSGTKPTRRKRSLPSSLICGYCSPPQHFSKSSNLKRHISATHMQKKSHVCEICQCAFSQLCNLKRHHSSVHLKEKPYCCEICGKVYAAQASLARHRASKHGLGSTTRGSKGGGETQWTELVN